MTSMRLRIFLLLVLMTSLVWGGSVIWVQWQTRQEVQHVLDRRLMESASMVSSLIGEGQVAPVIRPPAPAGDYEYAQQLSCQIWTLGGDLVARSSSAPSEMLAASEDGFSERKINGEHWRVYTVKVPDTTYRVMVGDSLAVRDGLVTSVVQSLLFPALLGLAALGLLFWSVLNSGLSPVRRMAQALAARDPKTLPPLDAPADASELHPIVDAVNHLMTRVKSARQREAEFTAAAAHEIRTPLAGIRLQAQVAASTSDPKTRGEALSQIQSSIDRTALLVSNLLTLAQEDESAIVVPKDRKWTALSKLLDPTLRDPRLELPAQEKLLLVEPDRFALVLNNLLSNAIRHADNAIKIAFETDREGSVVVIEDDGQGVKPADLPQLGQRFYRPSGSTSMGSGLGLSIAKSAAEAHGASLSFMPSKLGGLRIEIRGIAAR